MMWYGHGMWGYGFMVLNGLVFWALLVVGAVLAYRVFRREDRETAEGLLADRYARGEIDDEEYRRRMTTLRGQ